MRHQHLWLVFKNKLTNVDNVVAVFPRQAARWPEGGSDTHSASSYESDLTQWQPPPRWPRWSSSWAWWPPPWRAWTLTTASSQPSTRCASTRWALDASQLFTVMTFTKLVALASSVIGFSRPGKNMKNFHLNTALFCPIRRFNRTSDSFCWVFLAQIIAWMAKRLNLLWCNIYHLKTMIIAENQMKCWM